MNDPLNPTNGLDPIGKSLPQGDPLLDSLLPGMGVPHDPADPLNPVGLPGAVPDPLQLGDPMLDALEQSIINPPGFADSLTEQDGLFMDDMAKRLDQVEAGIENPSPSLPFPAEQIGGAAPCTSVPTELPEEEAKTPEAEEEDEFRETRPPDSPKAAPLRPDSFQEPPFTFKSGDGGHGRHREPFPRTTFAGGRSTRARGGGSTRFCPDTSYSVDKKDCQDCDKYRHWPEGTEKEPRECWHDWVATPKLDRRRDEVEEEE